MMKYKKILKRAKLKKTNYRKRRSMLMNKSDFVTVKISNENTLVQIHKPVFTGDLVVASAHSRFLINEGWKGSRKNISAAYLTGYLAGKKSIIKGIKNVILYSGTDKYTQRMAAALKGLIDAGLQIPADSSTFPTEQRINGAHLSVKNNIESIKSIINKGQKNEQK